jgi:hypothetical protein
MSLDIQKGNYIEWVKLIQRAYTVGYICAFVILSHILTLDVATSKDVITMPVFGVPLPRLPGVLFTLFIFVMSGFCILISYIKLNDICEVFDEDTLNALKNFPSVVHSSIQFEFAIVFCIYSIFTIIFYNGPTDLSFMKALWLAFIVTSAYIFAWCYKAYNKPLKRD